MTNPTVARHPHQASLGRAAGIDVAVLFFATAAVVLSFFTGQGSPTWRNLVFAPTVFVLAAITLRLVIAEIRALWPVLPDTTHRGSAMAALVFSIAVTVVVGPMLLIMPFIFFGAL